MLLSNNILESFLAISTWQSAVSIFLFFSIQIGTWFGLKRFKMQFMYRVLIGMVIGFVFGIVIQAITGFVEGGLVDETLSGKVWNLLGTPHYDGKEIIGISNINNVSDELYQFLLQNDLLNSIPTLDNTVEYLSVADLSKFFNISITTEVFGGTSEIQISASMNLNMINPNFQYWAYELNIWVQLLSKIFMNGIMMLTAPVVFIAMFRVTSKPGQKGVGRITLKGILLLLSNVFVAFTVTFALGMLIKPGAGMEMGTTDYIKSMTENVPLPQIMWEYFPTNFAGAWVAGAIIPLMVIAALFGMSVKLLSKRKPESMEAIRNAMDTGWSIINSVLMTFMKIMPLAVMSMLASSMIAKPIGALANIGKVIGLGYLGIIVSGMYITLIIFLSGVRTGKWWKHALAPLIQGFSTQSSNATLPVTMDTLKDGMKISDKVTGTIAPLTTSMGLMACAGVQAATITTLLWTSNTGAADIQSMGIVSFFLQSLVITLVASLGIAGVPGTAGVVTAGVLGGLGLSQFFAPVYAIVGALDGLFDMGRTGLNVFAGVAAATLIAKSEGEIGEDSDILSEKQLLKQKIISNKILDKEIQKEQKLEETKEKEKIKKELKLEKNNSKKISES